jgi:hypothetical protein
VYGAEATTCRRRVRTAVPDPFACRWRWLGAGWRRGRGGFDCPTSPPASCPAEAHGPVHPGPRRLPRSGVPPRQRSLSSWPAAGQASSFSRLPWADFWHDLVGSQPRTHARDQSVREATMWQRCRIGPSDLLPPPEGRCSEAPRQPHAVAGAGPSGPRQPRIHRSRGSQSRARSSPGRAPRAGARRPPQHSASGMHNPFRPGNLTT